MLESKILDPEDDQPYPDISSLHYVGGQLTQIPTEHTITANDMKKYWKMMYDLYTICYYDDLLMNINGIPYEGMLQPGSKILKIAQSDLEGWITNKSPESVTD